MHVGEQLQRRHFTTITEERDKMILATTFRLVRLS